MEFTPLFTASGRCALRSDGAKMMRVATSNGILYGTANRTAVATGLGGGTSMDAAYGIAMLKRSICGAFVGHVVASIITDGVSAVSRLSGGMTSCLARLRSSNSFPSVSCTSSTHAS